MELGNFQSQVQCLNHLFSLFLLYYPLKNMSTTYKVQVYQPAQRATDKNIIKFTENVDKPLLCTWSTLL